MQKLAAFLKRFHSGLAADAYEYLGCHTREDGEGYVFRVWAPHAQSVCVVGDFNFWNTEDLPMRKISEGVWEAVSVYAKAGQAYKYCVTGPDGRTVYKTDPYGNRCCALPDTSSMIDPPDGFTWHDALYRARSAKQSAIKRPVNIYEVHAGSWRQKEDGSWYTYAELADLLPAYCKKNGFTHIELMPLAEHPFDGSWGYQTTGFFAPTSRYGTPDELVEFVNACHKQGIGVILDFVPVHFAVDAYGLKEFDGTPLYEYPAAAVGQSEWGSCNFMHSRGEIRCFIQSCADYWLRVFHADGLRCDAVSAILYHDFCREPGQWVPNIHGGNENLEGAAFLKRLNTTVYGRYPGVMMIAEESTAYPRVTHPVHAGGLGFGFKWNMGWMNDMLSYIKLDPVYRKYHHDKLTFSLMYAFSENYILPFSHDEVVHGKHSMLDKNPGDLWQKFAGLRMLLGYQLCHPGKKLNFMGTEFAHFIEWKYEDQLDWFLLVYERHPDVQKCVRALNALYRSHPALWQQDDGWAGFTWLNADDSERSILSFLRWDRAGNALMCVTNFTPACYADYRVGLPAYGYVKEALNTDDPAYGGSGKGNPRAVRAQKQPCGQFAYSASIAVPPLSTVIYTYTRPQRRAKRNINNP